MENEMAEEKGLTIVDAEILAKSVSQFLTRSRCIRTYPRGVSRYL